MAEKIEFSEHPEYVEKEPFWRKYRVLYDADRSALLSTEYLWPHESEASTAAYLSDPDGGVIVTVGQHLRTIRALRSRYTNHFEAIISTWVSLIFKESPQFDEKVRSLLGDEMMGNIDGYGTSFEDFIKHQIAVAYFRDGNPIVLVDAPQGAFASKEQEKQAGFRPYVALLDNLHVKDWEFFGEDSPKAGKYKWLRDEYCIIEPRNGPLEKPKKGEYCKVYTVADGQYVQEVYKKDDKKDWVLEDTIPISGWDELPISTIRANESWCEGIAEQQLVHFNLSSSYYNQLNTQAHQRGILAGDLGDKHKMSINEYTFGIVPQGTVLHVLEPADTEPLRGGRREAIQEMFRIAFNRSLGVPADSKEAPGADTLSEMKDDVVSLLLTSMGQMEGLVNQIVSHIAKFKGQADFKGEVTFTTSLTAQDITEHLELYTAYRDEIRKVDSWRKADLKRAAAQMDYSEEEMKDIEKDIDDLEPDPGLALDPFLPANQKLNGGKKDNQANAEAAGKAPGSALGSEGRGVSNAA